METPNMETPKWYPTPDQIIEGKFGQEPLREAEQISKGIFEQIKAGIADIGMREGTSQEQKEEVRKYLEMWREFGNGLFARISSPDKKSPEIVETAIKGANSLFFPEPSREGKESAQKMKEALDKRY